MPRKSRKLPVVAICGRPNVGKSTLFNRLVGRQTAIVHKQEGITRDRAYGQVAHGDRRFRLVDTGGIVENPTDPITHKMQEHVRAALKEARAILFVVDGQQPLTRVDIELRDELFRYGKPVLLVVNKVDNAALQQHVTDYYELGMGDPFAISSGHGLGIDELLDALLELLPPPPEPDPADADAEPDETGDGADPADFDVDAEEPLPGVTRVAIVGKPNVGKSSFVNALINEERTIVTDIPGTTRDAIDIEFRWNDRDYLLIDTAGLRRKAGIREDVERFSVSRSLRTVRRAEVCLLLVDAVEGISEQDKRIADYIVQQGRPMVLVYTKWDLIEDKDARFKALTEELSFKVPFLKYVPHITISNVTRQRLFGVFEVIDRVAEAGALRIGTGELNRFMEVIRANEPAAVHKGQRAKVLYITQAGVRPTTFVLFVNQKRLFHFSFLRFIENQLRARFGFEGVPIKIELRAGKYREEGS